MIPKKIHYCWFGPKPFPKLVLKCVETWKIHFPDYEFYLWTESNSPMDFPYVKDAYEVNKFAFVSDYVRFWALYNYGGIYLDTDMFILKSISPLLQNQCFFGFETPDNNAIGCCVIGSESNNEFLGEILEKYKKTNFKLENIENLVIPRLITPIYDKYEKKEEIIILPFDYFYPFPYLERDKIANFMNYKTENTIGMHLWNLSWVSSFEKAVSKLIRILKTALK